MKIANFSVRNSTLINLMAVLIIFVGIYSMFNLRKEAFPQVDYDIVSIATNYPGAPAADVEKLVTIPLEKEIKGISGIKEINSISEEGFSEIGVIIDPKASDKKQVVDDIERAIDRVNDLPAGVKDDPYVFELKSKEIPVLEISISGNIPNYEIRKYAENLEDIILDLKGVASVRRMGWLDPQFHIEVDPAKMKEVHVSLREIMAALRSKNITLPGGHLTTENEEFNVRTTGEFNSVEEIENVIIRSNDAGNNLLVKDVAKTVKTFEDETRIARTNGKRTLGMVVVKSEGSDIIRVVDNVKKNLDEYKKGLPKELEVTTANDFSFYVKRRLNVLRTNGIVGFVLVLVVLFLFLDPVPAIMTAIGIPMAFFMTFFVMNLMGISINLVSMLGLIIVLGMLVDDGIVITENIYRYIEKGMDVKQAVIKGTNEVVAPVISTIITTWASFTPLLFIPDIMGKFIREIPICVIVALAASMFEAFVLLPAHLADFVKAKTVEHVHARQEKKWYKNLVKFYEKILRACLAHKYKFIVLLITGFIGIIIFAVGVYKIKIILFTGEGIEDFYIRAEAKQGMPLKKVEELLLPVEKLIETLPKTELDSYRTYIGEITEEKGFDPNAKRGTNYGQITIFLTPAQKRDRTQKEIVEFLRPKLAEIKGLEKLYFYSPKEGPPTGRAVEVGVKGDNFEKLNLIANQIIANLQKIPGVSDVAKNYVFGKKDLRIVVDEKKARKFFLTIDDIASTVRQTFYGGVATTVKPEKAEDEIEVLVRFPEDYRNNINVFDDILVENSQGNLVPLKSVARVEEQAGVLAITHLDGKRVVWITGDADGKLATSFTVNEKLKKEFSRIEKENPGYILKFGGEYEEQKETQSNLLFSFSVAMFIIFMILTAQFRSILQPFVIMTSIPFGIIGIIIAFMIHGRPLSFFALMGAVGLAGVVVNASIVLVDFINNLRKSGMDKVESLVEAGKTRLRPILMTSITTMAGLLSVAYGWGGSDPFLKPMGLAIVWGLFFSTGLTLLAIPCIYSILDDFSLKFLHHSMLSENGDGKE